MAPNDDKFLLFAGSAGIYRSFDRGTSWTLATTLGGRSIRAAYLGIEATRGPIGYALAGTSDAVFRSLDTTSWTESTAGLRGWFCDPVISADDRNEIYCGKFQTKDSAETWADIPFSPTQHQSLEMASAVANPDHVYSVFEALYWSDDRGATWTEPISDPGSYGTFGPLISSVAVQPTDPNKLILGNFISESAGATSGRGTGCR